MAQISAVQVPGPSDPFSFLELVLHSKLACEPCSWVPYVGSLPPCLSYGFVWRAGYGNLRACRSEDTHESDELETALASIHPHCSYTDGFIPRPKTLRGVLRLILEPCNVLIPVFE